MSERQDERAETRVDRPIRPLVPEVERIDPEALGKWLMSLEIGEDVGERD